MSAMNLNINDIKNMLKDPVTRRYVIGTGIFAVSMLYLFTLVIPTVSQLKGISTEVDEYQQKIRIAGKKIILVEDVKARLDEAKKELKELDKTFPVREEIADLLGELSDIASKADVKILSITPQAMKKVSTGVKGKYYQEMPIRITAKSGYHQLGKFVNDLESLDRIIVIDDLEINGDRRTPRLHDIIIMVKTYIAIADEKK